MKTDRRITSSSPTALVWALAHLAMWPSLANADAGAIRGSKRDATHQITVFTDPTPLRAGPVDVSVFVQDADTGQPILGNKIDVAIAPHDHPSGEIYLEATSAAASNKLFQAANFDLPHAGWWTFTVNFDRPGDSMYLDFEVNAVDSIPNWVSLWSWFCWPFGVVALFAMSLMFRRNASSA